MEEKWAEVEGYPNYLVSNYGQVFSRNHNTLLRPRLSHKGYQRVVLSDGGKRTEIYIQVLVARAFFGDFRDGMRIKHVNGDLGDNRVDNLRVWNSNLPEHPADRVLKFGTWGKRVRIIETGQVFRTVRDCANHIGGDYGTIYACLRGERNIHLGYTFEYVEDRNYHAR